MFILYVDESGDTGMSDSPTDFYVLSGLVVHELAWHRLVDEIIEFRRQLRAVYGLKVKEEIHAARCFSKPGELARIRKDLRLRMLRDVIDFQASRSDISIINVVISKDLKPDDFDVFATAWTYLLQRFHNTIAHRNFPGPQNSQDYGMVVCDKTDEEKLRGLMRRMRRHNPVPHIGASGSRQILLKTIVEDGIHRDSTHSLLVQMSDVNAYFLRQQMSPNGYVKKKGARNYFTRLGPVLCKQASRSDPHGVVRY